VQLQSQSDPHAAFSGRIRGDSLPPPPGLLIVAPVCLAACAQLAGMVDADQRLTRDVERLCDDLAALIPTLVKPVVDVAWFSAQLWALTGARGVAILYLYMAVGFGCLR
jgi:ABC transporter transmembrane region 2